MHVEKALRGVPRPQVIHFPEAETPPVKPCQQLLALPSVPGEMDNDVDVALGARGGVFRAAEEIEGGYAEASGIKLGRQPLNGRQTPPPVNILPAFLHFRLRRS